MKKALALLFALLAAPVAAQTIPSGPWGSINYWGVGGASQVLAPGTAGYCLQTQGVGSAPIWIACPGSALNLLPSINTNQFYCNTSGQFAPPVGCDVNAILNTVGYDIARPPAVESILYKSNVGPTFNWQALPPGTTGSLLTSGGPTNPPFWSPTPTQSNLASICQTVGALLYFDTPSQLWKCLNPGTAGQVLEANGPGANPSWVSSSALTSTNDTNVTATLGGTPATALLQPVSITLGWAGTLAAGRLNSNVVQSFTNDTNVTASISAQNATLGWTGTLAIARGGTGAATQQGALNNVAPTATRAGDLIYWNGSNWVNFAGNNSGTAFLTESNVGVPAWTAVSTGVVSVKKQIFTASGTYTPSTGMLFAMTECQGPGGGGGGSAAGPAGDAGSAGAGGAGGYSKVLLTAAQVGVSQTVTIGTGGGGGAAGANNGSAGSGATSVGTLCVANAGAGGQGTTPGSTNPTGGAGGAAGTGDIAIAGASGAPGFNATITSVVIPTIPGPSSFYGAGGPGHAGSAAGSNATGFGGGGSGGSSLNAAGAVAGGNGANGVVYITEYNSQ